MTVKSIKRTEMICPCCSKSIRFEINYKGRKIYCKPYHVYHLCAKCGKYDTMTEIHHLAYDDNDPIAHTIELCQRCHHSIPIPNRPSIKRDIVKIVKIIDEIYACKARKKTV